MTYTQVQQSAYRFATVLREAGIGPDRKVAVLLPNAPQFCAAYFGILTAGATVVPLSVLLTADEVQYHLDDSGSVALVCWHGFLEAGLEGFRRSDSCEQLFVAGANGAAPPEGAVAFEDALANLGTVTEDVEQTMPDDTAVILYTSGTTGKPKGAELSHFNLFFNCYNGARDLMQIGPDDRSLVALPLFHSFGQSCLQNTAFSVGAGISLVPRFDPYVVLETIQRDAITVFAGVPTMYTYMLNAPDTDKYDVSSLRVCLSGGAAIPVQVLKGFEEKFDVTILEGFGLSETSPIAIFNKSKEQRKYGSIGLPIWGVESKIVDDNDAELPRGEPGEIVIRGHNIMKGYYNKPEATAEAMKNGWFHSGDIGYQDDEGFFFITDRKKDMIIRGGYNVYPRELEEVLFAHPAVAEAAVIGVPDESLGEEVKACVVLKPDQQVSAQDIIDYCKEHLAKYKYPRHVQFLDDLPKGSTGKILKRELRDQYGTK